MQKTWVGNGYGNDWRRKWRPKYVERGKGGGKDPGGRRSGRSQGKMSRLEPSSAMWPKHRDVTAEHYAVHGVAKSRTRLSDWTEWNLRKSRDLIYTLQRSGSSERKFSGESRMTSKDQLINQVSPNRGVSSRISPLVNIYSSVCVRARACAFLFSFPLFPSPFPPVMDM